MTHLKASECCQMKLARRGGPTELSIEVEQNQRNNSQTMGCIGRAGQLTTAADPS